MNSFKILPLCAYCSCVCAVCGCFVFSRWIPFWPCLVRLGLERILRNQLYLKRENRLKICLFLFLCAQRKLDRAGAKCCGFAVKGLMKEFIGSFLWPSEIGINLKLLAFYHSRLLDLANFNSAVNASTN